MLAAQAARPKTKGAASPTGKPLRRAPATTQEPPRPGSAHLYPRYLRRLGLLSAGPADDPLEHEADRVAGQVMRMPPGEAARPHIRRAAEAATAATAAPPIVDEVLRSPGEPLSAPARAFFEPRFGQDFGAVRVHTDAQAADSARGIGAVAYTVGSRIVFGSGRYAPQSASGRALLAHELAHVAQNASRPAPRAVARQTVEQYETFGVAIGREAVGQAAQFTYWDRKLQAAGFLPSRDPAARGRMAFAEEEDAVLSVVWQMRPATPAITAPVTHLVTIPQSAVKGSRDLTYQIIFRPPGTPGGKATAEIHFVAEALEKAVTPEAPSTSFVPKIQGGYNHAGFPNDDPLAYWDAHQNEQRQVFHWIENEAPGKFDQIVTAKSGSGAASFRIKGERDPSGKINVSDLAIMLVESRAAPAGYSSHDFADALIEEAQSTPDPIRGDKLGRIGGLDGVKEAAERAAVKYAVYQYFRSNTEDPRHPRPGTRNAEVHAIVPIPDPPPSMRTRANVNRRVFYTFRFLPRTNDVEVRPVGEEGREVTLERAGSLGQVSGFDAHATGATEQDKVTSLTAWLKQRYPAISPAASATVTELERDVTAKIRDGSGDPAWFQKNYGIAVLDAGAAATWLATKVGFKERKELQDLKNFTPEELRLVELALERMSDSIVATFRGVRMVRQRALFRFIPGSKPPDFEEKPEVGGDTTQPGTTRTIRIFDAAMRSIDALFVGSIGPAGKPAAVAEPAQPIAHEFGHLIQSMPGVQKAFDALVTAKGIRPITWYAGTDPPGELFPEAFSLFYLDPVWLKENWLDLFNFFDTLDRTGRPPPATTHP
jgi:hypothetical protein